MSTVRSPGSGQSSRQSREESCDVGGARMADDQDAGNADCDAAHRDNGEMTWALEKDEKKTSAIAM